MYHLLIVDDEPEIVEFLADICSEITGLELEICKACTGRKALEIMNQTRIDVMLSDIKMPGMDGLQLVRKVRENWPKCKVIFLTGYKDFENIYTAVQGGGARYLLKTETDEKIQEAVAASIRELDESLRDKAVLEKAHRQIREVLPLLQNRYFADLLDEPEPHHPVQQQLDELSIPLAADLPMILFIGRFDSLYLERAHPYEDSLTLHQIVKDILPRQLRSFGVMHENYLIWMVQPSADTPAEACGQTPVYARLVNTVCGAIELIQDACHQQMHCTTSFSVADHCFYIHELSKKYYLLKKLLQQHFGIGREMLLLESTPGESLPASEGESRPQSEQAERLTNFDLLKEYLENGRRDAYDKLLRACCGRVAQIADADSSVAVEGYFRISVILLGFINRYRLASKIAPKISLYKLTRIDQHASWDEAAAYLRKVSEAIFDTVSRVENTRTANVVELLQQYIKKHLAEDLTLTCLSRTFHFNSSYLSRLFKQETGVNLSDYILSCRIEAAKYKLGNTDMKINEIAVSIGYDSLHSFSRLFHNSTGMSPHDYRLSFVQQNQV